MPFAERGSVRIHYEKDDFRCICADLRNANPGQSSGPLEIDRPWTPTPTTSSA
jgi:hypothetical protein